MNFQNPEIAQIMAFPGNNTCVECLAPNPTYTSINNATTPKTYTRDYTFTGNVKGSKVLRVFAKDVLDNYSNTYLNVYNLDNDNPTIYCDKEKIGFKHAIYVYDNFLTNNGSFVFGG